MSALRQLSEQLLTGTLSIDDAQPMAPRFLAEEIGPRTYFVSSFANVAAFGTDDGLVLVDTGSFLLADPTRDRLRAVTQDPVHTAIWTHGHVDHCFGVELYERDSLRRIHVIAHEAVPRRFERYRLTHGWNREINARQFRGSPPFPSEFRAPDETFASELAITVGGRRFELRHSLGETDDHTWVWVPDAGVICTGDLIIWVAPNCGNPQKVQRYPREWAAALRAMDALGAELLCPGHGVPIFGAAAVHRVLDDTASYLESLVDQVLALMNRGARLDEILGRVTVHPGLLAQPYLAPLYDEPEFIVHNIYRLYGGWWDGNPAHLKPARDEAVARELADLAGGAAAIAARAEAVAKSQDYPLACQLIELAAQAAPGDRAIRAARAAIYSARARRERSLMARNIFAAVGEEP